MDPKTSFFLDMKLFGNNTRVEGGWYSTSKVVDSDYTNFEDFVDDILHSYPKGYDDVVKLFYLADESHVEIRTDEELLAMFDKNLWPAAYSWNSYYFNKHWHEMTEAKPAAVKYLRQNHTKLWTRSQFSTLSKVDYVTNNLAESFNNWIKSEKDRNLDDLMDVIRQKLMVKWNKRRKIARKMEGKILPHIVKNLKERSRNLDMDVLEGSDEIGEVIRRGGSGFRYANYLAGFILINLNPCWSHVYDANYLDGLILIKLNPCRLHAYDTGMLLTLRRELVRAESGKFQESLAIMQLL